MNFRNIAYWLIDSLKGNNVNQHLKEINSTLNKSMDEITAINNKKVKKILKHAINTTDYYSFIENENLRSFPVINKQIIRNNIKGFISRKYNLNNLIKVVTSGSTGTPFSVYHDMKKKNRNTADAMFFANKAGYVLGEKLVYFKIWNDVNRKSAFEAWMQNIVSQDVTNLSSKSIKNLLDSLEKEKETVHFLGYSSAFEAICQYLQKSNQRKVRSHIKSAVAMSESLSTTTKEQIKTFFNVDIVSRYSNVENGILAQEEIQTSGDFTINWASYKIEILKMNLDIPCEIGEYGRIVITDLYNYAMPIIRYDTGDIGKFGITKKGILTLESVEGRKMDMVFNTKGELMSSFTITNQMWKYPEIAQYQFIQITQKKYKFILNVKSFDRESELINEFKEYFGQDAAISIEYIDEIPLLNSGKRRKVINEYYK